jgi:hypothetical protein
MRSIARRAAILAGAVVWLGASAPSHAQFRTLPGIMMKTGLMAFIPGGNRSVLVTVTELGARGAQSNVSITFFDAEDRVIATSNAILKRAQPVIAELPLDPDGRLLQIRCAVSVAGPPGRGSVPVLVIESIDPGSFTIEPRVSCAPPASREGPVTPMCPGVVVTDITIGG